MAAIKTKKLKKKFGDIKAVRGISFEVKEGEIFGFLGPNGAGKTTTFRILNGILKPDAGEAWVLGKSIIKEKLDIKEKIGVAPEVSNAYRELSSWQNLMFTGNIHGLTKKEITKKSTQLLKEFGLYDRRSEEVKNFSKGMKQRLSLSMALINDPEILFLDEPTSGLDVQSRKLIREKIKEINKEKAKTIFLTTHDIQEADRLCDRVAIIKEGKIADIEKPEKLKNKFNKTKSILISLEPSLNKSKAENLKNSREIDRRGDKLRIYTEDIDSLIQEVTEFAKNRDHKIITLKTLGPSLEDVFTEITEAKNA